MYVVLYTEWKLCNFMAIKSFHCHCHYHCQHVGGPTFVYFRGKCGRRTLHDRQNTILYVTYDRKYPPFPLLSYFSLVVCQRWLYYHILSSITYISREHWDPVSIICVQSIDVQFMVFANNGIHYGLQVVFVCLRITPSHYHHYANSSEGIQLIKCSPAICCRVCV